VPERDAGGQPSAEEQLRALYENAESSAAKAFEQAVATPSFGAMLARSAENVAAISRIGSDVADLVLRNLRLAGRSDITRLARQLHRTEDKLERVLQEIELLRDELAASQSNRETAGVASETASAPARRTGSASRRTGTRRSNPGNGGPNGAGRGAGGGPAPGAQGGSRGPRSKAS